MRMRFGEVCDAKPHPHTHLGGRARSNPKDLARIIIHENSTRLEVPLTHTGTLTGIESEGNIAKLTGLAILGESSTYSRTVGDGFTGVAE